MTSPNDLTIANWIKATVLGWLLGLILVIALVSLNENLGLGEFQFLMGIGMGVAIGLMQWRILRSTMNISTRWIWYSIIGVAGPFLLFDLLKVLGHVHLGQYYIIYSVLLAGVFTGYLQYLLLRPHFSKAALWIPATFFGWVLALLAFLCINYTNRFLAGNWPIFAANILLMLIGGLILGTLTGLCLKQRQKGKQVTP